MVILRKLIFPTKQNLLKLTFPLYIDRSFYCLLVDCFVAILLSLLEDALSLMIQRGPFVRFFRKIGIWDYFFMYNLHKCFGYMIGLLVSIIIAMA